jgi:hypothetical protein
VRVVRGHRIGRHVVHADEAAVCRGPRLFCLSDALNPTVNVHLVRLRLPAEPDAGFAVAGADRLEAEGTTPDGETVPLVLSPLAATGGMPNGIGRSHPVLAPPFKTWLPMSVASLAPRSASRAAAGEGGRPM